MFKVYGFGLLLLSVFFTKPILTQSNSGEGSPLLFFLTILSVVAVAFGLSFLVKQDTKESTSQEIWDETSLVKLIDQSVLAAQTIRREGLIAAQSIEADLISQDLKHVVTRLSEGFDLTAVETYLHNREVFSLKQLDQKRKWLEFLATAFYIAAVLVSVVYLSWVKDALPWVGLAVLSGVVGSFSVTAIYWDQMRIEKSVLTDTYAFLRETARAIAKGLDGEYLRDILSIRIGITPKRVKK
jgi:hypothetical protein